MEELIELRLQHLWGG